MQKSWSVLEKAEIKSPELKTKYNEIVLELLAGRGISGQEEIEKFFNPDYGKDVLSPFLFSKMEKATDRLRQAKENDEKIAIFGDYDADGVTATALLFETLVKLGFPEPVTYIPDRQLEGYGMNPEAIKYLHKENVKLIITVDCGIKNIEEVALAKELGIDVVITDHHHVPKDLPDAIAVINPHQDECGYPFLEFAGVGVAFKLAQALYLKIEPEKIEQLKWSLDLVAVGTIADCVPLLDENRTLVKYGLVVLSKTKRPGLLEMFKVGRILIDEDNLPNTQKIAFQISPRINAAGRMDHASIAYNLIVEKDFVLARNMALEVESKNQSRQKMTAEIVREIRAIAENSFKDKKLIFAYNEHWPAGILGLVAGKISEEFNKPAVVMQKQGKEFVGSLRSIPQLNIIESLEKCSDLLLKFGGHSQAAGVKIASEKMEEFYERLSKITEDELVGRDISPELKIDAEINPEDVNRDLIKDIKRMEPFGEGNREPVFLMRKMVIEDLRIVGNGNKHLKLSLRAEKGSPKIFDAIGFGMGEKFSFSKNDIVDVVCNMSEDEWNGNKKIQLRLLDLR